MCAVRNATAPDESIRYQVRAVTRALDVLIAFGSLTAPVDLATLARYVGLHPTTAFRYLESLKARGLVRHRKGGYELGSPVFELASTYLRGLSVWSSAQELAERLATTANETASLGVLDNGQVLYIAIAHGQRELGIQSSPGTRHPAYCTALGKAMLSELAWPEVEAILAAHPPVRLTARTLVEPDTLGADLASIRGRGYALDDEERTPGVICIGAPIRDHSGGVVAAISISGPAFRIHERGVDEMAQLVIGAAAEASSRLGADRTPRASPNLAIPSIALR
jgi:DNA-binding IclR family transcriptional regulator